MAATLAKLNLDLKDSDNSSWTEDQKEGYIQDGVYFLSRGQRPKVWTEVEDESVLTVADQDVYDLPANIIQVFEIWMEVLGTATPDDFAILRQYEVFNGQFRLNRRYTPGESGLKFRIKGAAKITSITDAPDEAETAILEYAQYRAMMAIANELTTFNTYSAKLQNISRNDVRLMAQYHKEEAVRERQDISKALKARPLTKGVY